MEQAGGSCHKHTLKANECLPFLLFSDKICFQNLQVSICLHLVKLNNQSSPNPLYDTQCLHLYDMLLC